MMHEHDEAGISLATPGEKENEGVTESGEAAGLAEALYAALVASSPDAFISGDALDRRVVVDGEFNLVRVASQLLRQHPYCGEHDPSNTRPAFP